MPTKKDVPYVWSSDCQKASDKLKDCLTKAPVLAFPNFAEHFILETDASGLGLRAVLSQKQLDGKVAPIAYASLTLLLFGLLNILEPICIAIRVM